MSVLDYIRRSNAFPPDPAFRAIIRWDWTAWGVILAAALTVPMAFLTTAWEWIVVGIHAVFWLGFLVGRE